MVNCAVPSCKNTSNKTSKNKDGITFHLFPRDQERRRKWEIAVGHKAKWRSTSSSAVCSEHFDVEDIYYTESGLRKVSTNAIPRINISASDPKKTTLYVSLPVDIKPMDTDEVVKLKHKIRRLEVLAADKEKRLNHMWQSERRLKSKLRKMKAIIKYLIQFKLEKLHEKFDS